MTGTSVFSLLGKLAIDGVDETKKALDDVAKGGKDAQEQLSVSFQDIGNKAGELGKKMALGLAGGITAITATYEATKEFRADLGRLEAGYEGVGLSGETANNVFKNMFGILGETDTAVEASNLLKELVQDEKGLAEWTTIATGVYARFPDSIPIESLIEASNETAKVGQVTGTLADALNWAGVSEEAFNEKLEKCNSEAEREKLIRDTLNGLYKDSATEYQNTNKGLIDNNKAQADLNMQMADAMAKVEPLITKGKIFLAEVLLKAQPAITWIIDNINILAPIVLGFMSALFALNIASKVMTFISLAKTLITTFSTAPAILTSVKSAMSALNLVLSANPVGLVIAAIVALIAIFVTLWNKCDWFREFWIGLWKKITSIASSAIDGIKKVFTNIINFVKNNWQNLLLLLVNPFAGAFKLLYDNCDGFRNFVDKWVAKIRDFFVNGFNNIKNKVVSTVTNLVDGAKNKLNSFKDGVKNIVDKIKGFFNFEFKIPKIKLPRFSVSPSGWKLGDLLKGSIPKLGIDWYAKAMNNPMLLQDPTAFGFSSSGNIRVGGEAGDEIVGGASTIMGMISDAVSSNNGGIEYKLDKLIGLLNNYLPTMCNQQVVLSTGELVGAMVSPMDRALGQLADDRRRGR